ncbi:MAG TPA: alpha/beta hydrolase [Ramlibacter sp.]|nr:alpha/beta hydrolase [Ramlibacter sp.]
MDHFFAQTSAGRIHGVRHGRDGAPPLLLLHSNGGAWRQYAAALDGFAATFDCYALDLPGQGDSFPLPDHWDIEQYSDVVVEVLDRFELERVTVLGCSVGGSIAIDLAARYPSHAKRLVIVETPARTEDAWAARWRPMESLFGVVQKSYEFAAQRVIGLTPEGYAEWDIDRHKSGAKTMVSVMWAMRRHDTRAALARLKMPTLVVFGESTPVADSIEFYRRELPTAPLVTLPGCGHFPMVENPHALVNAVLSWEAQHA